jgi:hypothetical protein
MRENILVVSCGNVMGTAVPHVICQNYLLLYLNLRVFKKKIFSLAILSALIIIIICMD